MTFSINDSIIKKIASIVILSVTGFISLTLISFFVFEVFTKIGVLAKGERDVSSMFYNGSIKFQQFLIQGNERDYDQANKLIDTVIFETSGFVDIHNLLKSQSVKEVIEIAKKNDPENIEKNTDLINLINLLHSTDVIKDLVESADALVMETKEFKKLMIEYRNVTSSEKKKQILKKLPGLNKKYNQTSSYFSKSLIALTQWISSLMIKIYIFSVIIILVPLLIYAGFIINSIIKPLKSTVAYATTMSSGDFTNELTINNKDEFGTLSNTFNQMVKNLRSMLLELTSGIDLISDSSNQLSVISDKQQKGSIDASNKMSSVSTASKHMESDMNSVSTAMEDAAQNVDMVATAAEEITSTINEIAQNTAKARGITEDAVNQTKTTNEQINDLSLSVIEIGNVTETINEISEQTNLLALNATIEAARAGEAGKGFSVVASEIKELANQTAKATMDIRGRVDGIQSSTETAIEGIKNITEVINSIDDMVCSIASAVEEQSVTTNEISKNVAQVSGGIQDVSQRVSSSSVFVGQISKDVMDVDRNSSEVAESSSLLSKNAVDLSDLSNKLKELIHQFKI